MICRDVKYILLHTKTYHNSGRFSFMGTSVKLKKRRYIIKQNILEIFPDWWYNYQYNNRLNGYL